MPRSHWFKFGVRKCTGSYLRWVAGMELPSVHANPRMRGVIAAARAELARREVSRLKVAAYLV